MIEMTRGEAADIYEEEIDDEIEMTPEEECEEEISFWGYRSRWPGKTTTKEKPMNKEPDSIMECLEKIKKLSQPIKEEGDEEMKREKPMNKISMITEEVKIVEAFEQTKKLCEALMKTPHYKKMGAEGVFAIVQKAKAVGVDPLDALNGGMYYVQGKVEMTSTMMNDLIRRKGHSITKDRTSNAEICILHGKRKDNNDTWSESFSIEDAKQACIYRNQWLKYPKDMLFARALSRLARQLFPDVIKGCYVEQEITQAVEAKSESPELIQEVVAMTIVEMKNALENNIDIPQPEHLEEYLEFCKGRVPKPMREVIEGWIKNPDPFKTHYSAWVSKKNPVEVNIPKSDELSLFEDKG